MPLYIAVEAKSEQSWHAPIAAKEVNTTNINSDELILLAKLAVFLLPELYKLAQKDKRTK